MKPELRVFLLRECLVNPVPKVRGPRSIPLLGLFAPKLIELALGGIASSLKKAGADKTRQAAGSEVTSLFRTDMDQQLSINGDLGCVLAVYGVFANEDGRPNTDPALVALERANLIPVGADIDIVFEAAVVPTADETAFFLEARHFGVHGFIGGGKSERDFVVTISMTTPNATADGSTIALGNIAFGRLELNEAPVPPGAAIGGYPRFRTNLMPWNRITGDAKDAYESDVKRNTAKDKAYMPITVGVTISETEDGNKFLAALGDLLEGAKGEAAKKLSALVVPEDRQKAAKEAADAAEALYQKEEDANIALKEADAALAAGSEADKAVLSLKLAKAKRAYDLAVRLRKAAGLADLPGGTA